MWYLAPGIVGHLALEENKRWATLTPEQQEAERKKWEAYLRARVHPQVTLTTDRPKDKP